MRSTFASCCKRRTLAFDYALALSHRIAIRYRVIRAYSDNGDAAMDQRLRNPLWPSRNWFTVLLSGTAGCVSVCPSVREFIQRGFCQFHSRRIASR